ncbi:helix-hairpin-helix domain-containing protein [Paenibacillus sp. GCM10023252]|uniref:helix-hairpin-helix domain-containing protein n=1 Tax=Paenibacillus sp. GCM10023252 TaxID=3252649 RepID=UPI003614186C
MKSSKLKLSHIASLTVQQLTQFLQVTPARASYLRGLAQFQIIPSIGPKIAERVVSMGYFSLDELQGVDPVDLTNRMELHLGCWEDPCVEDAMRCIVHHASHPGNELSWFDFTAERKQYRSQHGYPATRPTTAWYDKR